MKKIHHDALLSFGKYKGHSVEEALAADPGYFLWLEESGNYALDANVQEGVDAWRDKNKGEADKTARSARAAKAKREAESESSGTGYAPLPSRAAPSVTTDVSFAKSAEPAHSESWGTW